MRIKIDVYNVIINHSIKHSIIMNQFVQEEIELWKETHKINTGMIVHEYNDSFIVVHLLTESKLYVIHVHLPEAYPENKFFFTCEEINMNKSPIKPLNFIRKLNQQLIKKGKDKVNVTIKQVLNQIRRTFSTFVHNPNNSVKLSPIQHVKHYDISDWSEDYRLSTIDEQIITTPKLEALPKQGISLCEYYTETVHLHDDIVKETSLSEEEDTVPIKTDVQKYLIYLSQELCQTSVRKGLKRLLLMSHDDFNQNLIDYNFHRVWPLILPTIQENILVIYKTLKVITAFIRLLFLQSDYSFWTYATDDCMSLQYQIQRFVNMRYAIIEQLGENELKNKYIMRILRMLNEIHIDRASIEQDLVIFPTKYALQTNEYTLIMPEYKCRIYFHVEGFYSEWHITGTSLSRYENRTFIYSCMFIQSRYVLMRHEDHHVHALPNEILQSFAVANTMHELNEKIV